MAEFHLNSAIALWAWPLDPIGSLEYAELGIFARPPNAGVLAPRDALRMDPETTSFAPFSSYVSFVEGMAFEALRSAKTSGQGPSLTDILDGQAGGTLRETVPLCVRREIGAFFSSSDLRSTALVSDPLDGRGGAPVMDPAVGAGDLLIEVANHLTVTPSLPETLRLWGSMLFGRDLEQNFVRLAKARLVLKAISRGATLTGDDKICPIEVFPGIQVGDGLDRLAKGCIGGHIIMNPPFTHQLAPEGTSWARGRTNTAAIFLAKAVEHARPGTKITAILPDVIRTGSRYERLRSLVARRLKVTTIETYGQFDDWTDVDVFILKGEVADHPDGVPSVPWWKEIVGSKLGDEFLVSVGTVVPHRDPQEGPLRRYLHTKGIPLGGEFRISDVEERRSQKRAHVPPFVLIRRTSKPGDRSRGVGTLVHGTGSALVENHLIVLKPRDGSIDTCRRVIDLLSSPQAKHWLDERIRCRHLTVGAIREMPWFAS